MKLRKGLEPCPKCGQVTAECQVRQVWQAFDARGWSNIPGNYLPTLKRAGVPFEVNLAGVEQVNEWRFVPGKKHRKLIVHQVPRLGVCAPDDVAAMLSLLTKRCSDAKVRAACVRRAHRDPEFISAVAALFENLGAVRVPKAWVLDDLQALGC